MKITLYLILFSVILFSCSDEKYIRFTKEDLQGDWVKVKNDKYINGPGFSGDFGLGFQNDTIEFKRGFFPESDGVNQGEFYYFTQYELKHDSIFILNPQSEKLEFFYNIKSISTDTLTLVYDDTISFQMKKMKNENQSFTNFDQIIFSTEGCYGNCLAYSISLKSDGSVLFHGEGYVKNIGFYKAKIDSSLTKTIFRKYYNGNIVNLENNYGERHSHYQDIYTSFIKDGKIIKTIQTVNNYGRQGPNELLWANIPIERLQEIEKFDSIQENKHSYGIIGYQIFYSDSTYVNLDHSECFYLWTELNNALVVDSVFDSRYRLRISDEFYYTSLKTESIDFNYNTGITEVKTDGRYYQFNFESKSPIVYDLGYNFIEVNFSSNDFQKFED